MKTKKATIVEGHIEEALPTITNNVNFPEIAKKTGDGMDGLLQFIGGLYMTNYLMNRKNIFNFLFMVIIVSSLLDCQQKSKIIDADNNISIEEDMSGIDIKPYPNHPVFSFVYEKKEYVFSFFGKQENVTSVSIKINPEDTQKKISNYPIGLTDEDIILINTELKKSSGLNNTNINYDDIMIIAIVYAEKINDNYIEKTINIIPTAILQSFLVDHLLYVYYLPYYTVKKGDTLSSIALELFGDSNQYKRLFEYNPSLEWPNRYLQRGEKIRIPIDN